MAEELSNGEISRRLDRLDKGLEQAATKEAVAEFKGEVREKFKRAEALSLERRDALNERIDGVEEKVNGNETGRTAKAANWIAFSLLMLTAIGLIVTVLTHGGK